MEFHGSTTAKWGYEEVGEAVATSRRRGDHGIALGAETGMARAPVVGSARWPPVGRAGVADGDGGGREEWSEKAER